MKYEKEFREAHPETIGEKDKTFDYGNYTIWLEGEHETLKKVKNLGLFDVSRSCSKCNRKLIGEKGVLCVCCEFDYQNSNHR